MHTLIGLLIIAAAACATLPPDQSKVQAGEYMRDYIIPRVMIPRRFGIDISIINQEIDRINRMVDEDETSGTFEDYVYNSELPDKEEFYGSPLIPDYMPDSPVQNIPHLQEPKDRVVQELPPRELKGIKLENPVAIKERDKDTFAMTPLEKGYYEPAKKIHTEQFSGPQEGDDSKFTEVSPPRETRQNPNVGRMRNLVADNLGTMRAGFTHQGPEGTDKPRPIPMLESDPAEPLYLIALIAAIGAATAMTVVGLTFGWYTLSKRAKAAADIDYPGYGVTGPTIDTLGDRKLAQSAHMYHYQHQKQQIIAMERSGLDHRNGSVSDPESEEENEEGDYTVYECPGFATTGEMEVKNPLFSEEPTPATPGTCELVKPQPKD